MIRILCILSIVSFLITACQNKTTDNNSESYHKISKIADAYVSAAFTYYPENYINYTIDNNMHNRFSDNSLAGIEKWNFIIDSLYGQFNKLNIEYTVGNDSWYLYGYLKDALESSIQLRDCKLEFNSINHISGWQVHFARVAQNQPVGNEKLRMDAIQRWSTLPNYINNEITNLRIGVNRGYTVPKIVVEQTIEQFKQILALPITESPYYSPAKRDSNETFQNEWKELMENKIYPSLNRYLEFLKNEYYQKARESISFIDLPCKEKGYEALCRNFTSVNRTLDEIVEVSKYRMRIHNSKLKLHAGNRYGIDSVQHILSSISRDTTLCFSSKDEMLNFVNETIIKAEEKCKNNFEKMPSRKVVVKPISEHNENEMGSHYIPMLDEGNRPSTYYINLSNPHRRMRGEVESEIFHETFPGHHLQIGLATEKKDAHTLTKILTLDGYTEGWASYAQILADELGMYQSSYSRLYVLGRSTRMMYLDVMIHSGIWSQEDAMKYLMRTGNRTEATAKRIICRVVAWPGQLGTYDTGLIEFLELREKAMLTLGDSFNIKEFHKIVLEDGLMPLSMLREKVDWWINSKQ